MTLNVCPADTVHAPVDRVWELLMHPAGYGRFWDLTIDRVEPYFTFGAGYAKLGLSGAGLAGIRDLDVHGVNGRAGVGLDYYAGEAVTVGVNFTGDLMAMAKSGVDLSVSPESQAEERARSCDNVTNLAQREQCLMSVLHEAEGTSFGFAGAISLVMGLHF